MGTDYVVDKHGCRLEVTDTSVNVRIRFRGSVAIPLSSIRAVSTGRWRSTRTIRIETAGGVYEWALGDEAADAARAVAGAAAVRGAGGSGYPRREPTSGGPWAAQNAERDAGLFLRAVLYAMLSHDASTSAKAYATAIGQSVTEGNEKFLLVLLSALTYFVGKVHFLRDDPFHDPDYLPYSRLLATHFMIAATQCLPGPCAPREQVRIANASRLAADMTQASMALVEALGVVGSSAVEWAS